MMRVSRSLLITVTVLLLLVVRGEAQAAPVMNTIGESPVIDIWYGY